jgi:hypothetical protein
MMLWHGITGAKALPDVLREGLKVPSEDQATTGFSLGKGLYFTDCFSKAAKNTLTFAKAQKGKSTR